MIKLHDECVRYPTRSKRKVIALYNCFLANAQRLTVSDYDGIDDGQYENTKNLDKKEDDYDKFENPYYESSPVDGFKEEEQRRNEVVDLEDTEAVTKTDNIYYEGM